MNNLLTFLKQKILQAFWFIPALFAVLALFATTGLNWLDGVLQLEPLPSLSWAFTSSPEAARSLLSTIAGSSITVLGVILSTMVVVLTLASQQYGPRLVRNFIEDRPSQVVIGCFAGCFIYSLVTLKSIHGGDAVSQPHLSILGAVFLAVASIGLLIFFVHHVASEIQVQSIIRRVYRDLCEAIEGLFPDNLGEDAEEDDVSNIVKENVTAKVTSGRSGYVQSVDEVAIVELATKHRSVLHLKVRPGDFVVKDAELLSLYEGDEPDEEILLKLQRCILIGTFPTATQDVRFPIRQLEEIAVRALSPGVNDPHTAIECLDYLTSSMLQLSTRQWPSSCRMDAEGAPRVLTEPFRFEGLLRLAYQQIHHYGREDVTIVCKLLNGLQLIANRLENHPRRRKTVIDFAQEVYSKSREAMSSESDRAKIQAAYEAFQSE